MATKSRRNPLRFTRARQHSFPSGARRFCETSSLPTTRPWRIYAAARPRPIHTSHTHPTPSTRAPSRRSSSTTSRRSDLQMSTSTDWRLPDRRPRRHPRPSRRPRPAHRARRRRPRRPWRFPPSRASRLQLAWSANSARACIWSRPKRGAPFWLKACLPGTCLTRRLRPQVQRHSFHGKTYGPRHRLLQVNTHLLNPHTRTRTH